MKWMILAICAEVSVLLCLIFSFDAALHSLSSARLTWDHAAVAMVYTYVRVEFSRRRGVIATGMVFPTRGAARQGAPPAGITS